MAQPATKEAVRKLDKRIGMLRFRIKHAGTGRSGAPAAKLTAARKKEMSDELKAMLAEREVLRGKLPAKTAAKKAEAKKPAAPRLAAAKKQKVEEKQGAEVMA